MRIAIPPPEIGDEEGFTPDKDIFKRAETGRGMTNLVSKVSDPLVIAVDGQWGSGKTTFLKMWAGELRKSGFPVVYFDAFANDYAEDAFSAIADEIIALAIKNETATKAVSKKFVKGAVDVGRVLARGGVRLGVKLATLGALNAEEFEGAISGAQGDIATEAADAAGKLIEDYLDKHRAQRRVFSEFRKTLGDLPIVLAPKLAKGHTAPSARPLVIIIDELDRCRPPFALQVLERIKHFFAVPNVHFVLGAHLEQLRNAVTTVYGKGIDAQSYLVHPTHRSPGGRKTISRGPKHHEVH